MQCSRRHLALSRHARSRIITTIARWAAAVGNGCCSTAYRVSAMTSRDELKAKAEQLLLRARASAASCKGLLHRVRSLQGTVEPIQETEAPRLAPE